MVQPVTASATATRLETVSRRRRRGIAVLPWSENFIAHRELLDVSSDSQYLSRILDGQGDEGARAADLRQKQSAEARPGPEQSREHGALGGAHHRRRLLAGEALELDQRYRHPVGLGQLGNCQPDAR